MLDFFSLALQVQFLASCKRHESDVAEEHTPARPIEEIVP